MAVEPAGIVTPATWWSATARLARVQAGGNRRMPRPAPCGRTTAGRRPRPWGPDRRTRRRSRRGRDPPRRGAGPGGTRPSTAPCPGLVAPEDRQGLVADLAVGHGVSLRVADPDQGARRLTWSPGASRHSRTIRRTTRSRR